jgi:hypothetical protein
MKTGTISFQANDKADVFWVVNVLESGEEQSDETFFGVIDPEFENDKAWVTGKVPMFKPIHIEGDTALINAWFKAEDFDSPFEIKIYLECEAAEELAAVIEEKEIEDKQNESSSLLDPIEVNL